MADANQDPKQIIDALKAELNAASPATILPADQQLARVKNIINGQSATGDGAVSASVSPMGLVIIAGIAYLVLKKRRR